MTNPYEDNHHINVGELGFLALLGAILTLPDAMLRRVLKRLAIMAGIFALIVGGLIASVSLSRPVCFLGPEITAPSSNDPQLCKQNAEKRSAEARAAMAKLEAVLERDRPR
jgi:hypothetical protein